MATLTKKPTSALLINEGPLQVLPSLAVAIGLMKTRRSPDARRERDGLNEAIALQQLHYRLTNSKKVKDGRKWEYDSYDDWQADHFPFWSERTVQRIFLELEELGLIITEAHGGRDRRKWYTIDYDALNNLLSDTHTPDREEDSSDPEEDAPAAETGGTLSDVPTWHNALCQVGTMEDANLAPPPRQDGTLFKDKIPPKNSPENTHTPRASLPLKPEPNGKGVGVSGSRFTTEERLRYANNNTDSRGRPLGPGWVRVSADGSSDPFIEKWFREQNRPHGAPPERDNSACPDCKGRGFYYPAGNSPEGMRKGTAKCMHPMLNEELQNRKEMTAK